MARQASTQTAVSPIFESENEKRDFAIEEGKRWAESVDAENAWDKLVLSLDGGGIRGYSSLLILDDLMKRIAKWEEKLNSRQLNADELLPCHYFDYMWGTSTGGLIAIMLGRLRMSVLQALSVYRDVGESIFGKQQRRTLGGANIFATRYDASNVEKAVKKITRQYCRECEPGECTANDRLEWTDMTHQGVDNANNLCQAVCVTARATGKHSQALPLRSYHYEHHPSQPTRDPYAGLEDLDLLIWEAARATSAAPFYFKIYEKRDKKGRLRRYKDGGTLVNNPAGMALHEVRSRYELMVDGRSKDPAVLLSIGTGIRHGTPFAELRSGEYAQSKRADIPFLQSIKERLAIAKHIVMRYTEGENVHRMIRDNVVCAEHLWYKRLNVDVGLGEMDLGDWRKGPWTDPSSREEIHHSGGATLTDMENATRTYLKREELHTEDEIEWYLLPSEMLDHVAERLVRHRIERRKLVTPENEVQWQTYQGRYVSGRKERPWDNDSHDLPKSPQGSVENLKHKTSKSTYGAGSGGLR